MKRYFFLVLLGLLVTACGGGGGGSGSGGGSSAGSTNGMTFSPSTIAFNFPAGVAQNFSVTATPSNPSEFSGISPLYVRIVDSQGVLNSGFAFSYSITGSSLTQTAQISSTLPMGSYQGNFQVIVCGDSACENQLPGSPWVLPYNIQVTPALAVQNFAGSGKIGAANGLGATASFNLPGGLAVDSSGNVYVSDSFNNLIRKISPSGLVSTLAGSGMPGSANGLGATASFHLPGGLAVDSSGNVYVADISNNMIRKVTPAGEVSTLAGSGQRFSMDGLGDMASFDGPSALAVDSSGNVYVVDNGSDDGLSVIRKITPDGVVSTLFENSQVSAFFENIQNTGPFFFINAIAVDSAGNLYLTGLGATVFMATPAGVMSVLAGNRGIGSINGPGNLARFYDPSDLALDNEGNVYVADMGNNMVRKITPAGNVTTIAGPADLSGPGGIAIDNQGNMYVADNTSPNNVVNANLILKIGLQ